LDDNDLFSLVKRLVVFFHMVTALSHTIIYLGFSTGNKVHKYYFGLWTLSGIRMCFVGQNKRGGWLSLRWFSTTNVNTQTRNWASDLPEEDGHRGAFEGGRPADLGGPAWGPLCSSWIGSSLVHSCLLC
jgi:hypothetical protein